MRSWTHLMAGTLVTCALMAPGVTPAVADHHESGKEPAAQAGEMKGDAQHEAMMAEMMKNALPGKQHEALKPFVGKWKAVVKSWQGPGEPVVSEGTMENSMILGGRYLQGVYHGAMLGQEFDGVSLMGYDNQKGELISFWMDSMSTGWMTQTGELSEDGRKMTTTGTAPGPDGTPMELKSVTEVVGPDKHTFTMYGMVEGQEQKMMEITYTRM